MRRLMMLLIVSMAVVAISGFQSVLAQEQEDDVRGAFLTTRPKTTAKPAQGTAAKSVRKRPKAVNNTTASSGNSSGNSTGATNSSTKVTGTAATVVTPAHNSTPKIRAQKLGMGLTLFMKDSNGLSVRVDPSREFRKGESVRLLLETNADGYLYIFNTTDGGKPLMIYPDADLDEGGNYIQAHVPVEVPSSVAAEERLRWFRFDAQAGVERLYFVFTREPISGVPLEDALISFCQEKNSNCPLRPADDLWAQVQKDLGVPVQGVKAKEFGEAQTSGEQVASTRGIGLSKEDPEPSLVMMTASSNTATLVTTLDLIHK